MSKILKPNRALAVKVAKLVTHGLVRGVGKQEPGKMCVEAVVNAAFGLPHGDEPPCVSRAVRAFKIALNDSEWSSDSARAKGLQRLAVAQLGSDGIDEVLFVKELALSCVRKIVPIALRAAAKLQTEEHAKTLNSEAEKCESVKDLLAAARSAAESARSAARSAAESKDQVLSLMAECAVEALTKCKSPGCKWLDVCKMK